MTIDYRALITLRRAAQSTREFKSVNQAVDSDRGRIIFSSPFRRLQNKAQVFPLEGNASVRSRLTHSLEVAHIGRYIAQEVLGILEGSGKLESLGLSELQSAFSTLVENACLLHDIGNPPFGHFGEAAIRSWFSSEGRDALKKALPCVVNEGELEWYADFLKFDGNAQGFRIVTKLQGEDGVTGLNLTYSQLASFSKYVVLPQHVSDNPRINKKPGYFNTEKSVYEDMRHELGLAEGQRFSLAFLMEAADDIAYCLSDVEDGIEKGLVSLCDFVTKVKEGSKNLTSDNNVLGEIDRLLEIEDGGRLSAFVQIRTRIFNKAVESVSERFCGYHEAICSGEFVELIEKGSVFDVLFSAIRRNVAIEIYQSRDAEHVELAGYSVVYGLLQRFSRLLCLNRSTFQEVLKGNVDFCKVQGFDLELRLAHMLPSVAIKSYKCAIGNDDKIEWLLRAHLILDYVCGMTDNYALKTYRLLSGIRIGEV